MVPPALSPLQVGDGLPELRSQMVVLDAMGRAGLEISDYEDLAKDGDLPWSVDNSYLNAPSY